MTATRTTPNAATFVRAATPADHADMVKALSAAFDADPVFRWIFPDATRRARAIPPFFELLTDAIGRHSASLTTGDDGGAALWVPPGEQVVDERGADAFEARIGEIAGEDIERAAIAMELLESQHPHEPHWYLNFLGVSPYLQGCGVGSALLRNALARADADPMPAYLEATSSENRRLYERHGFDVTQELTLPDGPSLYAMWRPPRLPFRVRGRDRRRAG
jgi:ribosomal protein S18 acetylase RimI-like enzyme